jgi:hypothetical protein
MFFWLYFTNNTLQGDYPKMIVMKIKISARKSGEAHQRLAG